MKKKPAVTSATTTTATNGTKIRTTMLITVSTRSLVFSTLIILLSVNTSSTFQYDWWNNLTNASSQDASRHVHDKVWLPAEKGVREKFWSTAWTPMISVTAEADAHHEENKHQQHSSSTTTPAPHEVPAEAAAVTSYHPALLSLSETGSSSSSPSPPAQPGISTSTTLGSKSESLEWQPSIVTDHKDETNDAGRDDFNAFAARNTRTYAPLVKIRSKSAEAAAANHNPDSLMKQSALSAISSSSRTQKVSWDDHLEFPSSTSLPLKVVSEVRATTTSIWADQGTSPSTDPVTSSTNSRKWSSRQGSQRITSRFGSIKTGKQQRESPKAVTLVEEFKQSQNLKESYEDAVADIQSNSQQQQQQSPSSSENEGSDVSGESERLSFAGKTSNRNQNKERLAVKGRQQQQSQEKKTRQQKRQKVALQIQISQPAVADEQDSPQKWSNAKVSQYFRWENPDTSSERLVEQEEDEDQSSLKQAPLTKQAHSSSGRESAGQIIAADEITTTSPKAITKTNPNRSGAIKGVTKAFARQRKPSIVTTTTLTPDYESEEEALTERSVTTTQRPRLESSYEQASRQAVKPVKQQQQKSKTRKSNAVRLSTSAKSQSIVQSSGRGYEWSSDIDHNDDRPAEIKSTTISFNGDDRPPAASTRFSNPTTTSIPVTTTRQAIRRTTSTTTTTTTTTARPTIAARLQTKGRQTGQRQISVGGIKSSFEQNSDSISSTDSDDDDAVLDEAKAKFQKKSGVQYSSSVEREEDVTVERDFNKKSGEQGAGNNNPDDPENCRLEDSIPGTPLTDYPTYSEIPKTNFKCSDQTLPGYYGDVEAQCQVFHVCQHDGRKNDFLCPVGTIFNQEIFVCDWWQNFRCQDTPNFYQNNDELYKTPVRTPSEIANNQLRKRTDTIEREDDEPAYSDEVRDDSGSSNSADDSISNSAEVEDEVSTDRPTPAPAVSRAPLAVKGYKEKQVVTNEPTIVTSAPIQVYGARMSRKQRKQKLQQSVKLAAAAATESRSSSSISPAASSNLTSVVPNVTMKMSTSALPLPVN